MSQHLLVSYLARLLPPEPERSITTELRSNAIVDVFGSNVDGNLPSYITRARRVRLLPDEAITDARTVRTQFRASLNVSEQACFVHDDTVPVSFPPFPELTQQPTTAARPPRRGSLGEDQETTKSSAFKTAAAMSGRERSKKRQAPPQDGGDRKRRKADDGEDEVEVNPIFEDERMKNVDPAMAQMILNEILDVNLLVTWDDISGLAFAKKSIQEMVIYPMLRPDIYFGIRAPPKGLLLFGPPGTGKTMIGRALASQAKAAFFNISASSLTSKWVGEGEKMVRALFTVAKCHPSERKIIFIDEIDSLLTQRSDKDVEASRRIKTEFLLQMEGVDTQAEKERILVVGATNRPQEIDEAARRRFVKRLYIPLPEEEARKSMIMSYIKGQNWEISNEELTDIARLTEGYSGSDIKALCCEAALRPVRDLDDIMSASLDSVRPILKKDFVGALQCVRSSVSVDELESLERWNTTFGTVGQ